MNANMYKLTLSLKQQKHYFNTFNSQIFFSQIGELMICVFLGMSQLNPDHCLNPGGNTYTQDRLLCKKTEKLHRVPYFDRMLHLSL